jgi:predicted unusual protein kinase regulating ubiquinone biosynthesis (AarF/ABC1/UbiB family)
MSYLPNLYRLLKLYYLFTDCELPENFLPQNRSFLITRVLRLKKKKNKSFSEVLIQLGPSYIKLGQFLATRPDIIGGQFAIELSTLQDNLPTFPIDISKKIIEEDFNSDILDVFVEFNEPIAAASIAQVHTGFISDNQKVAIKVLRPNIEKNFYDDFKFFLFFIRFARKDKFKSEAFKIYRVHSNYGKISSNGNGFKTRGCSYI